MGSNEEYLDKLLQSVTKDEKPVAAEEHEYSQDMTDDELLASLIEMYSEELAEFKTEEIIHKDENDISEEETVAVETVAEETISEQDNIVEAGVDEADADVTESMSLDDLLGVSSTIESDFSGDFSGDFSEGTESVDKTEPATKYTSTDSDYLSQSDIEALLSSLQDDLPQTTTEVVNEDKIIEDFSAEADPVLEEILSEPQTIDEEDADILIPEKNDGYDNPSEDNLLKEMGIESMSAEQIDELLSAAATSEQPESVAMPESKEMDLNDLFGGLSFADDFDPDHKASEEMADLLGGMLGGNDDLAEINELLQKADNNETVDDSNLRNILGMEEDIGGNDLLNELLQADSGAVDTGSTIDEEKKPKKEKKQKVKKEKQPKQPKQPKEKKEGESLWKKMTSLLFEEDEDLDDEKKVKIVEGDGIVNLVDINENESILNEMMNEDKQKGKKSKNKKDKGKTKKNKAENADSEDGEEIIDPKEQAKLAKQKAKAEKAAAKKKAKEEKAEADRAFLKAQPSISTKRAMVAFVFALSIMAIVLLIYAFVPTAIEKANARKAFYNKDYYEAYELLQGKELNDSDTILLNKVTYLLKMQRKLDSYNNYVKMDKKLEAVNLLMEAVKLYEESYTYAKALSIAGDFDAIYDEILLILNGRYGVSEEMAKEINACESDVEYTVRLQYLIEGKTWGETDDSEKPMEDVLPEEEDFLEGQ